MEAKLGQGVYTLSEGGRLTGLKYSRLREWFRGSRNVFSSDYAEVDGDYAISFHDLIDVFVAGQLRDHGVALQTLRRVYERMRTDLKTPHPFCRKELLSDGKMVFMRGLDAEGREELSEVLTRQKVFPQILLPFLQRIEYDQVTILAKRWRIGLSVILDPAICFGKPIVEQAGIPTSILASAFNANNRDADLVGDWYNVSPEHVLAAVAFERTMAA